MGYTIGTDGEVYEPWNEALPLETTEKRSQPGCPC
jgi:hypothetical protein